MIHKVPVPLNPKHFQTNVLGAFIDLFTLINDEGMLVELTNYGARVVSLWVLDEQDHFEDVVLGYDTIDQYFDAEERYFGATVGPYANRIAKGAFQLYDKEVSLEVNNGNNHLHGGDRGLDSVVWTPKRIDAQTMQFAYQTTGQQKGYPKGMDFTVQYHLTADNALSINYWATTLQPTICNLTHHSFFNLNGQGEETVLNHALQINSDAYLPIDEESIPTGTIADVTGTPFDFNLPKAIGFDIKNDDVQLKNGNGYDHNFILSKQAVAMPLAATVYSEHSGIGMRVYTSQPGMQLYTGNFLNGILGKWGATYARRGAVCLECQHFPDSPNQPHFPSTLLTPYQQYNESVRYQFYSL